MTRMGLPEVESTTTQTVLGGPYVRLTFFGIFLEFGEVRPERGGIVLQ